LPRVLDPSASLVLRKLDPAAKGPCAGVIRVFVGDPLQKLSVFDDGAGLAFPLSFDKSRLFDAARDQKPGMTPFKWRIKRFYYPFDNANDSQKNHGVAGR
jgi:hypothetical protein